MGCVGSTTNQPTETLRHHQYFKDLVMSQRTHAPDRNPLTTSIAWNELGKAWMLNKEWVKGEECFEKSIESAKLTGRNDPTDTSLPKVNLGLAYWFTQRLDQASLVITQALQEREDKFGINDNQSFM